jgi:hypothetical protein
MLTRYPALQGGEVHSKVWFNQLFGLAIGRMMHAPLYSGVDLYTVEPLVRVLLRGGSFFYICKKNEKKH